MRNKKVIINDQDTIDNIKNVFESCLDCKACMRECSMLNHFKKSPKQLFQEILDKENLDVLIPYSCNMCGSCVEVCPKRLKLGDTFMSMRKEIAAKNGGKSPLKGHNSVRIHQRLSFSKLFNTVIRDEKVNQVKRVFMPGCSLCSYNPDLVFKTFSYLKKKLPGTAIVTQCCGSPAALLGEEQTFSKGYKKLQETLDAIGADEIITACQSCFVTISRNNPDKKVKSLWTVLEEIGIPKESKNIGKNSDLVFGIHDSCATRDREDIHDSIRWIMKELGYEIEELRHSRNSTRCCGMGGMVATVNPEIALKVMNETASEGKTDYIVTYCASCRASLAKGGKKSLHILNLIFEGAWGVESEIPQATSIMKSWVNRYKVRMKK